MTFRQNKKKKREREIGKEQEIAEYLEIRLAWSNFDYVNFSESSHQGTREEEEESKRKRSEGSKRTGGKLKVLRCISNQIFHPIGIQCDECRGLVIPL